MKHEHRQPCPLLFRCCQRQVISAGTHNTLHVPQNTHIFVDPTTIGMIYLLDCLSCLDPSPFPQVPSSQLVQFNTQVCTHTHRHRHKHKHTHTDIHPSWHCTFTSPLDVLAQTSSLLILCPGSDTQLLDDWSSFKFASKYRFTPGLWKTQSLSKSWHIGTPVAMTAPSALRPSPTRLLMVPPVAGYWSRDTCIPALTPVAATNFHSYTKRSHQCVAFSPHGVHTKRGMLFRDVIEKRISKIIGQTVVIRCKAQTDNCTDPFLPSPCFIPPEFSPPTYPIPPPLLLRSLVYSLISNKSRLIFLEVVPSLTTCRLE